MNTTELGKILRHRKRDSDPAPRRHGRPPSDPDRRPAGSTHPDPGCVGTNRRNWIIWIDGALDALFLTVALFALLRSSGFSGPSALVIMDLPGFYRVPRCRIASSLDPNPEKILIEDISNGQDLHRPKTGRGACAWVCVGPARR
jgi:hypothetical protein